MGKDTHFHIKGVCPRPSLEGANRIHLKPGRLRHKESRKAEEIKSNKLCRQTAS